MIIVKKNNNDSIDLMIKKFSNKVKKTKLVNKLRENEQFTKKSIKKRQQKLNAIYLQKKELETQD